MPTGRPSTTYRSASFCGPADGDLSFSFFFGGTSFRARGPVCLVGLHPGVGHGASAQLPLLDCPCCPLSDPLLSARGRPDAEAAARARASQGHSAYSAGGIQLHSVSVSGWGGGRASARPGAVRSCPHILLRFLRTGPSVLSLTWVPSCHHRCVWHSSWPTAVLRGGRGLSGHSGSPTSVSPTCLPLRVPSVHSSHVNLKPVFCLLHTPPTQGAALPSGPPSLISSAPTGLSRSAA